MCPGGRLSFRQRPTANDREEHRSAHQPAARADGGAQRGEGLETHQARSGLRNTSGCGADPGHSRPRQHEVSRQAASSSRDGQSEAGRLVDTQSILRDRLIRMGLRPAHAAERAPAGRQDDLRSLVGPALRPLTSLAPVAQGSLLGGTVSFAGYVAGNCSKSCTPCDGTSAAPDSIPPSTGWLSTQAESFGLVVAGRTRARRRGDHALHRPDVCRHDRVAGVAEGGKSAPGGPAPVEQPGRLAIKSPDSRTGYDQRFHVGLPMRDEIVKLLRQRLTIDHVMPTF